MKKVEYMDEIPSEELFMYVTCLNVDIPYCRFVTDTHLHLKSHKLTCSKTFDVCFVILFVLYTKKLSAAKREMTDYL